MANNYKYVSQRWLEELKDTGYEYHIDEPRDCRQLELSRVWKRILEEIRLPKSAKPRILEVGCGGGIQIAKLAAMGWECVGLDVSPEVLSRAEKYFEEIREVCGVSLNIKIIAGDFYDIDRSELGESFDLVFNFGVIEHILDDSARLKFLKKKYDLTRKNGYIISMVPNGSHPLREKMKRAKLGGYNIPEIDYNHDLMQNEFETLGAKQITILPHNLFVYLLMERKYIITDYLRKLFYLTMQIAPQVIFSRDFCFRHAGSLIGIARK
jgi:SAM-dependent methyltransferase